MKTQKEIKEDRFAKRFFLFLLVMAIIGALSSCTPKDRIQPLEANALHWDKKIRYNKDSTAFRGSAAKYRHHTWCLDTTSGFYLRVQ